jgi:crotonobetainyl-CoA:carnitine CoA-transferase CaiB-like acyl-CoA transferase
VRINQGGAIGEFITVGCPFTISGFQPTYAPCPEIGQNTTEVLTALDYTPEQQSAFASNGTTAPLAK